MLVDEFTDIPANTINDMVAVAGDVTVLAFVVKNYHEATRLLLEAEIEQDSAKMKRAEDRLKVIQAICAKYPELMQARP